MTTVNNFPNNGFAAVLGPNRDRRAVDMVADTLPMGAGRIQVLDGTDVDAGNATKIDIAVASDTSGLVSVDGANDQLNVYLGSQLGAANAGLVSVHDQSGNSRAGMFINANGQGELFSSVKAFVEEHPGRDDGAKIVYISLEGPEAAMFYRGKAELVNGSSVVELPEHFTALAAMETASVQLTPHSARSFGLAVSAIDENALQVAELAGGNGSYEFSFTVTATRAQYLDHEPVVTPVAAARARSAGDDEPAPAVMSGMIQTPSPKPPVN